VEIEPCLGIAEPVAALLHLGGAVVALILAPRLVAAARGDQAQAWSVGVFAACVVVLLASSGLYHLFPHGSGGRFVFRRLDHVGIWLTTAACSTPIWCFFLRHVRAGVAALAGVWALAVLGATLKTIYLDVLPPYAGVMLFVAFGAVGIPVAIWLVATRGLRYTLPFFLCGVLLTAGALLELIEEPTLIPGVVGYHEVVHVCVMGGLFAHWAFVARVGREVSAERTDGQAAEPGGSEGAPAAAPSEVSV
jgi:hemolysin III